MKDDDHAAQTLRWLEALLEEPGDGTTQHLRGMAREALDGARTATSIVERHHYESLCATIVVAQQTHANRQLLDRLVDHMNIATAFGDALHELDELGEHEIVSRLRLRALGDDEVRCDP